MTQIHAYKDRGITKLLQILDADGDVITPGQNDKVRVLIGRGGQTPLFTVTSDAATDNGSSITKGAQNTLRLDASDLEEIPAGVYTLFLDYFDNADSGEWKNVDRQVFSLEDT
jgi:hypothetical protein